jgi:micrococcal nuclease
MRRNRSSWLIAFFCLVFGITQVQAAHWLWVDKAVDGDTFRLKDGRLVRYIGINAPEIDHENHRADPYAWEAYKINRQLVDGKRVRLEQGREPHDQYGRILAYVYDEKGRMINQVLMIKGLGYFYGHRSNIRILDDMLLSAQRRAMQEHVGIWKELPLQTAPFIANSRTRRFHTPQCRFGKAIDSKNEVRFKSLWAAYWQGYAPCDRCLSSSIKKELKHR